MDERLTRFIRTTFRTAGRRFEETRRAYRQGRDGVARFDLPADDDGRARLVCRRDADRRAVRVDDAGHPECFDADHPDCRGCVEDIRERVVETW